MKDFLFGFRRRLRQLYPMSSFAGSLFIVGAQKSGTSALYSYLKGHPQLACGDSKEIHFFDRDKSFIQGPSHYRSFFPARSKNRVSLDATPKYLYSSRCAERIYKHSPNAKIVVLLREPASRAFSGFNMYQQLFSQQWFRNRIKDANQDWKDFLAPLLNNSKTLGIEYFLEKEAEIIESGGVSEEPSLMRRGLYAPQIERYVNLFGRDNVLILFSDDLKKTPENVVEKVLSFAGLTPMTKKKYPSKHVRQYTVDKKAKEKIQHFGQEWFKKDREILIQTYGLKVPW